MDSDLPEAGGAPESSLANRKGEAQLRISAVSIRRSFMLFKISKSGV
jgi:hypothetical protein